MRAIAGACGLTDPAIYYHFASKRELQSALLVEPEYAHLARPPAAGGSQVREAVETLLSMFDQWNEQSQLMCMAFVECLEGDPQAISFSLQAMQTYEATIAQVLAPVCGSETREAVDAISRVLAGVLVDAALRYGSGLTERLETTQARSRRRNFIALALWKASGGAALAACEVDPCAHERPERPASLLAQRFGATGRPRATDSTWARILDAAIELFGRQGFEGTTVREIAAKCRISDAAVYHHFGSKRDLLHAAWEWPRSWTEEATLPPEGISDATLEALVDLVALGSARDDAFIRLLFRHAFSGDPAARDSRNQTGVLWMRFLAHQFERNVEPAVANMFADAIMMVGLGEQFHNRIEHGNAFPAYVLSPEARARMLRLVRAVAPYHLFVKDIVCER